MLKKYIIGILLFLLTTSLVACKNDKSRLSNEKNIDDMSIYTNQQGPNELSKISYKVIKLSYSKNNIKIKYPQISGLSDNNKQKRINDTLKNEAFKVLKYYQESEGGLQLDIDYEVILKDPNILSIQYSGYGNVDGAAHPNNLFYTTNIDIKTGNRLRLKDIVNIDKVFVRKFLGGEFKALIPKKSEVLKQFSQEFLDESFKEADSLDNIGTDKQSDVFSYFKKDSLGISIGGVGHAIGDHVEFEIKYKDLTDNIRTKNDVWKYLSTLLTSS